MSAFPLVPTLRLVRLVLFGAPLWLLAVAVPGAELIGALYLGLLTLLCWRDLQATPRRSELSARREMPQRFSLDQEHQIKLILTNHTGHPIEVSVRDEVPGGFELVTTMPSGAIPGNGQAQLLYAVRPSHRGAYSFGNVVLRAGRRLGLLQRQISLSVPDNAKVYPNFYGVDEYELLAKIDRRDEVVRKPRRSKAPGTDFESLRAYMPGEDLRNIDWKATAKRGSLISRNKQVERGQQLAVLVDAGRLMSATVGKYSKLEHAMNATALLSFVVQKRGDALAVASFSNRIESFLPPVRGPALVPRVLESIYAVQARPVESDYWQVIAEVMALLRRRSLIILLTDVLDTSASAGLMNNLARATAKHLVLCVVLTEPRVREAANSIPTTVVETYGKAAAADLARRRRLALEHMRARGILVLETDPQHLTIHLVRRYLEIRQADLQ